MTASAVLAILSRWLHLATAAVAVGGVFYARIVVPIAVRSLPADDPGVTQLLRRARRAFKIVIHSSILFLLVSGTYNAVLNWPAYTRMGPGVGHGLFGLHLLLGLTVFEAAAVAVHRGRPAAVVPERDGGRAGADAAQHRRGVDAEVRPGACRPDPGDGPGRPPLGRAGRAAGRAGRPLTGDARMLQDVPDLPDWAQGIVFPVNRWLHVVCTTLLVGGTLFYEFVLPRAIEDLREEVQLSVLGRVRWVFRRVVVLSTVLLILTGAASIYRLLPVYRTTGLRTVIPWVALHVALGLLALAIGLAVTGRTRAPRTPLPWLRVNFVILLITLFVAAVARHLRITLHENGDRESTALVDR